LRDKLLPLLDLAQLLHLGDAKSTLEHVTQSMLTVVVIQIGARLFGVLVDSVFRTEEIVVKPMSSLLREIGMFSGNTILGDGSVIMIIDPNALAAMVGSVDAKDEKAAGAASAEAETASGTKTALLLFRAGSKTLKAVPLSLITRLEEIERASIERCNGDDVVQYRGALMPLSHMESSRHQRADGVQPVLVFTEGGRAIGFAVDEIVDIVEERLAFELQADTPGIIGAAIVRGNAVEVIDVSHYLGQGLADRLVPETGGAGEARLLLVDDSQFFRNMLAPLLMAAGYDVTLAASAEEALALKDRGAAFDLIVSDLDMPGMDGFALAERLKADPRWERIPLIALSSHTSPRLLERARAAGFVSQVGKFDRQTLMAALSECRKAWEAAA
jgi:two-component system chemotaxis sensor kinase CheA